MNCYSVHFKILCTLAMVKLSKLWSKSVALIMFTATIGEPYPLRPWSEGEEWVCHTHKPSHQKITIQKVITNPQIQNCVTGDS